jgi:hypothetical protein
MKSSIDRDLSISILKDNFLFFLQYDVHQAFIISENPIDSNILEEFYSMMESFLELNIIEEKPLGIPFFLFFSHFFYLNNFIYAEDI